MKSPKMLMAVAAPLVLGTLVFAAVYALGSVLLGGSATGALPATVGFVIIFPPAFWFGLKAVERRNQKRLGVSAGFTPVFDNEPVCFAETIHASRSADSTAAVVEDWIAALKGQPRRETRSDGNVHIDARLGSRFVLRMFGLNTPRGRRALPMRVDVTVRADSDDRAQLDVTACSDAGWYAFRLPSFEVEYRQGFDARVSQLKKALRQ